MLQDSVEDGYVSEQTSLDGDRFQTCSIFTLTLFSPREIYQYTFQSVNIIKQVRGKYKYI